MNRLKPIIDDAARTFDLNLIAQRILKLSEIATLDHLDTLERSQARNLSQNLRQTASSPVNTSK